MKKLIAIALVVVVSILNINCENGSNASAEPPDTVFEAVSISIVYSSTDDDAQVAIVIDAGMGLDEVNVVNPDGRTTLSLTSATTPNLGQTKIEIETPEPSLEEAEAAYPEGTYQFSGKTVDGGDITGEATLSHEIPSPPVITSPPDGSNNLPINGQTLSWNPVPGAAGYAIEFDQENLQIALKADLLSDKTSFNIPSDYLLPDQDYVSDVAAIGENGNRTISEVRFHTAN